MSASNNAVEGIESGVLFYSLVIKKRFWLQLRAVANKTYLVGQCSLIIKYFEGCFPWFSSKPPLLELGWRYIFLKRSSKRQMFVFTADVLPSRVNHYWNHQPSDLHDSFAGGRAVLRLPVHRDCLLQRRRVLKLPETGIHQIMFRQFFIWWRWWENWKSFTCVRPPWPATAVWLPWITSYTKPSSHFEMSESYLIVAPPLPMIAPTISEATRSLKGKSTDLPRPPRGRGPCEWWSWSRSRSC